MTQKDNNQQVIKSFGEGRSNGYFVTANGIFQEVYCKCTMKCIIEADTPQEAEYLFWKRFHEYFIEIEVVSIVQGVRSNERI